MIPFVTSKPQVCVPHSYPLLKNSVIVPLVSKLPFQTNHLPATHLAKVSASHLREVHIIGFMQRSHKNLPKILPQKNRERHNCGPLPLDLLHFPFCHLLRPPPSRCLSSAPGNDASHRSCVRRPTSGHRNSIWPKIPRRIRESTTSHTN